MVRQNLTLFREQIFQDSPFDDSSAFQDDVHDQILLSPLEREVVDSPEFQRLFRLGQLGFVDLVYHTANHTRGAHCIGTCGVSKRLIDGLNRNNAKFASLRRERRGDKTEILEISKVERVLISLGALLHDLSHGPFSHDIEKKTHRYVSASKWIKVESHYGPFEKHDNYHTNPALYVFLMDTRVSVLARILRCYSRDFYQLLADEAHRYSHLSPFFALTQKWKTADQEILPSLLFHLLVFEKTEEAARHEILVRTSFESESVVAWGLGPQDLRSELHQAWYQPFRHDIIGNTLSADLVDYLLRDLQRLGKSRNPDWKMLDFYTLAPQSFKYENGATQEKTVFRTALDLNDYKRGTVRAERINDIFRLLDLRHEIHEKAVYHRIVQSAIAMMSRAALMLEDEKPPIRSLYGLDGRSPALAGDDHFMTLMTNAAAKDCDGGDEVSPLRTIPWKLAERRMYRPLMLISGDRVPKLLSGVCNMQESLAPTLRELAAVVDSTYYSSFFLFLSWCIESLLQHSIDGDSGLDSYIGEVVENEELLTRSALVIPKRVIFWTTPYKQLYKDPALLVRVADQLVTLENLPNNESISEPLQDRVKAGILDAETKNEGLWKLYVFLSDGLFYTGPLSKLLSEHPCNIVPDEHLNCLRSAQNIVIRGLRTVWEDWEANRRTGLDLSKPASPDHFRQLLTVFRSERVKYEAYNSTLLDEVSEVAVGEYLHGEDLEKCRDIRYKYDVSMSFQEAVNNIELPVDKRELVLGIADLLQVSDKQLATQETQEFLVKLARRIETDKEFEAAISRDIGRAEKEAARGRLPIHPERLRAVYLGKLTPASLLREKTNV